MDGCLLFGCLLLLGRDFFHLGLCCVQQLLRGSPQGVGLRQIQNKDDRKRPVRRQDGREDVLTSLGSGKLKKAFTTTTALSHT